MRIPQLLLAAALAGGAAVSVAQQPQESAFSAYTYADFADLSLSAPIVASAQIREAIRIKDTGLVPAGYARFYVEADVKTLIRGAAGLPSQVRYLVDVPLNAANRPPKLRKAQVLLFARTVPERADEIQLVARDGQLPWTPETEKRVREVLLAGTAADAPPAITGVGSAFHVPGAVPGESETQIFLPTSDGRPVSLNVLRRPGEEPRWAVALGEMVDEAAEPPARDTLLWYRLACSLPDTLPAASTAALGAREASAAQADYALIRAGLGGCARVRPR